jgi:MFS family permease
MLSTPHRADRALLPGLICLLFLVSGLAQTAIVPVLPRITVALHLGPSTSAVLLALPGLAMLVVAMPAGVLADRFGARRVALVSGVLLVVGCGAETVGSLPVLLAGRLLYGISFGALWTSGAAWLAALAAERDLPGGAWVGRAVVCSSVGTMVGPALGGLLGAGGGTGHGGWAPGAAAFAIVALAGAAVTVALAAIHEPRAAPGSREPAGRASWRELPALVRDRSVLAGAGSLLVAGALAGVAQLLIPSGLHADGASPGEIGLVFSACALGYIATSAVFVRLGARAHSPAVNALVTALAAVALVPALASGRAIVLIAALMFTAAPRGAINVVAYGLAGSTRRRGGAVFGLLGMAWAAATVLMPLLAAGLAEHVGPRAAYLAAIVPALVVAGALGLGALPRGGGGIRGRRVRVARAKGAVDDLQAA